MQYTEGYLLDGRYILRKFIGRGSYGEVWSALDKETGIEAAVKIYLSMDPDGIQDFKKEFQLSFDLNHTNLLHANYLGVSTEDSRPYLVMPLCPDGSSSGFIGTADENTIWRFIRDVASGLAYLHDQHPPIIHQDIKPDNILISRNGDFVITDFGISKQLRNTLRQSMAKLDSAGSVSYMGPERFSRQSLPIKASDIWSLGVTVYELAVGELPFCGMGGGLQKRGADIPELPDNFSDRLNTVMMSCLALEAWERPTARQLEEFASKVLAGEDPQYTWTVSVKPEQVQENVIFSEPPAVPEKSEPGNPVKDMELSKDANAKKTSHGISLAVWLGTAIAGLVAGLVLNFVL